MVCTKTVLIGHHTSGVRREFYRDEADLAKHRAKDPTIILKKYLLEEGFNEETLSQIEIEARKQIERDFNKAILAQTQNLKLQKSMYTLLLLS